MINERLPLSIGSTPGVRAVGVAFGLVFAAFGAVFVLAPLVADGYLQRLTGQQDGCTFSGDVDDFPTGFLDCPSPDMRWDGGVLGLGPARFLGLCGLPFVVLGLYMALRALRTAAWLDGTKVQVRGAGRTRTVDLATAAVTAGVVTYRRNEDTMHESVERLPTIIARDPASGHKVTIPLQDVGSGRLPPHELRALADAMTAGRSTVGRDADVHVIADQLRTMAANPLGL